MTQTRGLGWSGNRLARFLFFRVFFSVFFLVLLLVSGFGCKKAGSIAGPDQIRIGEVGSMSGSDATFGISTHQGIVLAIDEANQSGGILGKHLELLTVDDQGKASEAVSGIQKLISQDRVRAVLGEVASTLSLAMAPVAQQYRVPLISPSSINSKLTESGDWIFRVCFIDRFQSKVMSQFALNQLHVKKVAILQDIKSDYSRDSAKLFSDYFTQAGGKVVLIQTYAAGDIDFKSQLTSIRAANVDLILVPGYYTEIGLIARQKKELGMSIPLLGGDGWDSPKLTEIGGSDLEGSFFVSHFSQDKPSPQVQKFIQTYQSRFGQVPDGLAALGYDAALLLIDALKRSKLGSAEDLKKALGSTESLSGVTGKISIGPDRNAVKQAVVFRIGAGGKLSSAAVMGP